MWLTGLNKQLAIQIIHVNGTENENQDLQCNWQRGGYTPPAEGTIFVFGLRDFPPLFIYDFKYSVLTLKISILILQMNNLRINLALAHCDVNW